jgi:hypothetical protein
MAKRPCKGVLELVHGECADDQPRDRCDANAEGGTDQQSDQRDDQRMFSGRTKRLTTSFFEQIERPYRRLLKQRPSHMGRWAD